MQYSSKKIKVEHADMHIILVYCTILPTLTTSEEI